MLTLTHLGPHVNSLHRLHLSSYGFESSESSLTFVECPGVSLCLCTCLRTVLRAASSTHRNLSHVCAVWLTGEFPFVVALICYAGSANIHNIYNIIYNNKSEYIIIIIIHIHIHTLPVVGVVDRRSLYALPDQLDSPCTICLFAVFAECALCWTRSDCGCRFSLSAAARALCFKCKVNMNFLSRILKGHGQLRMNGKTYAKCESTKVNVTALVRAFRRGMVCLHTQLQGSMCIKHICVRARYKFCMVL